MNVLVSRSWKHTERCGNHRHTRQLTRLVPHSGNHRHPRQLTRLLPHSGNHTHTRQLTRLLPHSKYRIRLPSELPSFPSNLVDSSAESSSTTSPADSRANNPIPKLTSILSARTDTAAVQLATSMSTRAFAWRPFNSGLHAHAFPVTLFVSSAAYADFIVHLRLQTYWSASPAQNRLKNLWSMRRCQAPGLGPREGETYRETLSPRQSATARAGSDCFRRMGIHRMLVINDTDEGVTIHSSRDPPTRRY